MRTGLKRKVLGGLVVTLGVWPLAHHFLVDRYGLDKWSFLGFSMYVTTKPFFANETLHLYSDGRALTDADVDDSERRAMTEAVFQFKSDLVSYGEFCEPEQLARNLFQVLDQADAFSFEFDFLTMDRETAIFVGQRICYECRRSSGAEVTCRTTTGPTPDGDDQTKSRSPS